MTALIGAAPEAEPSNVGIVMRTALDHYDHLIALYENMLRGEFDREIRPIFEARLYEMREARRWLHFVADLSK